MGLDSPDEKERKAGNKWAKLGRKKKEKYLRDLASDLRRTNTIRFSSKKENANKLLPLNFRINI